MTNIGIVVAMEEEAINIREHLKATLPEYEFLLCNNVYKYSMEDKCVYVIISGIGMNNAIIACSQLAGLFHCTKIYNIGTCGCIKASDVKVGDIKCFSSNILNYAFRLHPSKYRFDDCNIRIKEFESFKDLLITCSHYGTTEILEDSELSLDNVENIFVDMEGYGVAAFCEKRLIPYNIIKVVSDFGDEEIFDQNVEKPDTYHNLYDIINKIIIEEK